MEEQEWVAWLVWGKGRNPSWLYSCKLHCSGCCSGLEKMKIWEEGSLQGSLALDSRNRACWLGGLLAGSDGWWVTGVRAERAAEIPP